MSILRSVSVFALAALLGVAIPVAAQPPTGVALGQRVRIQLADTLRQWEGPAFRQSLRGTLIAWTTDSVRIVLPANAGSAAIPVAAVRRLDVSGGTSRMRSALRQGLAIAAFGALTAVYWRGADRSNWLSEGSYETSLARGAAVGAVIGVGVGAIWPHERWRRTAVR